MNNKYDAIVIGAGMSGGWAAKEFCDQGIKTLLLERGPNVEHIKDYPTTNTMPWEFKHRGKLTEKEIRENPIISKCYAFYEGSKHFFVKDDHHKYIQKKPFDWLRGYQVGGKSIMWARQVQRWSKYDFEGPSRDGYAVEWPIGYDDLKHWYTHVEKFVGVSGNKDGLDILPDGDFLKTWEANAVEEYFTKAIKKHYSDRHVIHGRAAHLTEIKPIFIKQGRGLCMSRTICERGCPLGGYFNANSTLIPWAMRTGNLDLKPNSVVHSIIYDDKLNKAVGARVIDNVTKNTMEYYSKVIFVTAATLNTNLILLNSKSLRFPNGLGNDNGLLGKFIAFHNYRGVINAKFEGMRNYTTKGRKPTSHYLPRFRNVYKQETDFLRGYAAGFSARPERITNKDGLGKNLLDNMLNTSKTGLWNVSSHMMGETIPKITNQVYLDSNKLDQWGIPLLNIDVDYDNNDEKMVKDFFEQFEEMFNIAGFKNIRIKDNRKLRNPGNDIHEMGGVRMGKDPKTSLLNKWNQLHNCKNVFVSDGACMTSTSTQNPSLTFMAISARAANYAIKELKKNNI